MSAQIDKNNVELKGELEGSFYPSQQSEILRNVILHAPFQINGGIFAHNIRNVGGGLVTGPVLAAAEVTLVSPPKGASPLKFLSGINANLSITVEETGNPVEETVVSDMNKAGIVIRGDVISDMVKLENSLVVGNIRSRQATIVNSMIVGSILVEEDLIIKNCLFVSFAGGRVVLQGQNGCWLPYATSLEPIVFEETPLPDGEKTTAELRYLALCRTTALGCGFTSGEISCAPFITKQCPHQDIRLSSADIRLHKTEDGQMLYALNLAQRALDLAPIEEEIKQVETSLKELLIFEHLDKSSQQHTLEQWSEKFRPEEKLLFQKIVEMI